MQRLFCKIMAPLFHWLFLRHVQNPPFLLKNRGLPPLSLWDMKYRGSLEKEYEFVDAEGKPHPFHSRRMSTKTFVLMFITFFLTLPFFLWVSSHIWHGHQDALLNLVLDLEADGHDARFVSRLIHRFAPALYAILFSAIIGFLAERFGNKSRATPGKGAPFSYMLALNIIHSPLWRLGPLLKAFTILFGLALLTHLSREALILLKFFRPDVAHAYILGAALIPLFLFLPIVPLVLGRFLFLSCHACFGLPRDVFLYKPKQ